MKPHDGGFLIVEETSDDAHPVSQDDTHLRCNVTSTFYLVFVRLRNRGSIEG